MNIILCHFDSQVFCAEGEFDFVLWIRLLILTLMHLSKVNTSNASLTVNRQFCTLNKWQSTGRDKKNSLLRVSYLPQKALLLLYQHFWKDWWRKPSVRKYIVWVRPVEQRLLLKTEAKLWLSTHERNTRPVNSLTEFEMCVLVQRTGTWLKSN